jgi:VWFA-related protein
MNALRFLLALVPAVVLPFSALAQDAPAEPPSFFGEALDVRVVNVEAVVTDREGNRVPDLKQGDFRLQVDGKEVPVSFFTEVRDGRPTATPGAEAGEAVGTGYLVFIDDYFSTAVRRDEVLREIHKDLSRLGPRDSMAIVAFDGARLTPLSGWTSSAADLGRALDTALARPARGLDRVSELRSFLESQDFSDHINDDEAHDPIKERVVNDGLREQERAYGSMLVRQLDGAVSAAVSAMRGAGAPRGRKVMLLLAGGWPFSIQSFVRGGAPNAASTELPSGEQMLRPLTSTANLLGFTIYPVDVPGIEGGAAQSSSFAAPRAGAAAALSGFGTSLASDNLREQEVEGSLSFLAKETGGRAMLNGLRAEVLTKAADDVRSYYWLGFTPAWERNNRRHEVKVTVQRPGVSVRSRNSFLDLSAKAELSIRMESALLFGHLPDAIAMPMKLGAPVRSKTDTDIPLTLALPVSAMTVIPSGGKFLAHLELRIAASDENGNRSDVPYLPLDLSADKLPKPDGFVRYDTRIKIHGKAHHLVVATYDPMSGKIATAEADLVP